jgi:hypothetical protein
MPARSRVVACAQALGACLRSLTFAFSGSSCGVSRLSTNRLRHALERIDAGPGGTNSGKIVLPLWHLRTDESQAFWTLREESVIYVSGRPHVLRLVDRP